MFDIIREYTECHYALVDATLGMEIGAGDLYTGPNRSPMLWHRTVEHAVWRDLGERRINYARGVYWAFRTGSSSTARVRIAWPRRVSTAPASKRRFCAGPRVR
jgi:hypothetical protein